MKHWVNGKEVEMTEAEIAEVQAAMLIMSARTVNSVKERLSILDGRVTREKENQHEAGLITLPQELVDVISEKVALREELKLL